SLVRGALARPVDPPDTEFRAGGARVAVGSGRAPRGAADVWMVRYRPGVQTVDVRRGENRGEDVPHLNVVRELVRLGGWSGRPVLLRLPQAAEPGLATVVLVQAAGGGRILAVERQGD
ncbi:MAG TPA: DUF1223 domain-containing protein, partial [Caulobacteraceae bacterium]